jgi:uncharacterized membrane protein YjjB (DUF3815 family)
MLLNSLYAIIATFGFCILFNIRGKNLFYASFGGGLGWFSYLYSINHNLSVISSLFIASLLLGIYSEIIARIIKTPVTVIAVCSLIPLVPGSGMYYSMFESVQGNINKALEIGLQTLLSAGALAVGIVLASSSVKVITNIRHKKRT